MSLFAFKYNSGTHTVDISNVQGEVLYKWPLTTNHERRYTFYLLARLIGDRGTRNAIEKDCAVIVELEEKDLRVGIPPEYHCLSAKTSLWETIKSCFKKESHHARN